MVLEDTVLCGCALDLAAEFTPQCRSIPLCSISLTGFALCQIPKPHSLMCEHNAKMVPEFDALLMPTEHYTIHLEFVNYFLTFP